MYRFSRSIYRSLAPLMTAGDRRTQRAARQRLLEASESAVNRLVSEPRYFRHPSRSLFEDVRHLIPVEHQRRAQLVIERNLRLAVNHLERMPPEEASMLRARHCRALTRQGEPCRRDPLPGSDFCPSHKHLERILGPQEIRA